MEITPEEIENYQEDMRNFVDNSFDSDVGDYTFQNRNYVYQKGVV